MLLEKKQTTYNKNTMKIKLKSMIQQQVVPEEYTFLLKNFLNFNKKFLKIQKNTL